MKGWLEFIQFRLYTLWGKLYRKDVILKRRYIGLVKFSIWLSLKVPYDIITYAQISLEYWTLMNFHDHSSLYGDYIYGLVM